MDVLGSFIEALGSIVAAGISIGYLDWFIKKRSGYFFNYADKNHNLHKVMRKAKKSITIVANCGDGLLEKHSNQLLRYMKNGVQVNYVLLDNKNYVLMDQYTRGVKTEDYTALVTALKLLNKLKKEHPERFTVRVFRSILTASYIGIDLEQELTSHTWNERALIQIMPYHYHTMTRESPITYLYPKDREQFTTIADSIFEIFDDSEEVDIEQYCLDSKCLSRVSSD